MMFGFLKNNVSENAFPLFLVDMHSHLLPGVDDGSPDVETSLRLIQSLQNLGYKQLITTPHIYSDLYPNTPESLQSAYDRLLPELRKHTDIPIRFAAEYFLDDFVDGLIRDQQPLLTIRDNWVLVETSFIQPPPDLDRRLFDLQMAGYKPILAHPERYPYWYADRRKYHEFREKGLLLQLNLLSITGYYGKSVADVAKYLIKEELVDLVGTDCHHDRHAAALQKGSDLIGKQLGALIRKDKILNAGL